ncbi:MAG: hypothetical protein A3H32_19245 [Betaproteobacteria bacterium RIFCSPLOWO2_02_FULL_63_19]|nr:MAG: hypothetical protein A3H32_19245 [Betaproteobacteria bacterium RIFCSPLOWO2_02_FULL_63_19]
MEFEMLSAAGRAILIMSDPLRLMFLGTGVLIGLALGVIPGLGGIVGMALLLPFTFSMDPYAAFGMLLGMGSVTTTSDTIPAVLFGVPGTTGSAATVLDGHPLAKQGQAGRALGAAYTASLVGGVFGALLLAVSIPILRPVMLHIGSPQLLAFAVFGLCMVAALSAGTPLRGLTMAGFGILLALIGADPQTGTLRWTLDTLYLWDKLPLVPVTLGLFAIPELADMAIARRSIAGGAKIDSRAGQWQGVKDVFTHWWLVIRVSWLGAALGAIPGIGAAVIDWIAYGHALRTEKGAAETFGKGDIRGVLASEGSNNAKEGGSLVPTIAFGVPGSASMAILLGVFLIHGLQPGPDMLGKHLDVTYAMVWSVALANIMGAGICFAFSNQFAKIALIRGPVILPLIIAVLMIGAFQGSHNWGDLVTLVLFGVLGWTMKRLGWPRPPLILGFVLGKTVERYLFISHARYGWEWLSNPIVLALFALAAWGFLRPLWRDFRASGRISSFSDYRSSPRVDANTIFYLFLIVLFAVALFFATRWRLNAKLVPLIVGGLSLFILVASLLDFTFRRPSDPESGAVAQRRGPMDLRVADAGLDPRTVAARAAAFLAWLLAYLALTGLVGMLPATFAFVVLYMWIEGRERWGLILGSAAGLTLFCYFLFDRVLHLAWPRALPRVLFPEMREFIPSL